MRRSETSSIALATPAEFSNRIPALGHPCNAIDDPHNTLDSPTSADLADVELESAVMKALSDPYLSRADRLRNAALHEPSLSSASE